MSPKDCAYIVERLAIRFMAMVADHSRQLTEHRAAFGARTEADRKIIAGLRSEIGAARMAVLERDSLISERAKLQSIINEQSASAKEAGEKLGWTGNESAIQAVERVVKERDGLLTQVHDMRAEMERLKLACSTYAADWATAGKACRMRVDEYPLSAVIRLVRDDAERAEVAKRLVAERDALRAEVADLRGIVDMVHASLGIKRGDHIGNAIAQLKAQTPKRSHPVAVGEYLRRLTGFSTTPAGEVAQVLHVDCDAPTTEHTVKRPNGQQGVWSESGCEPCDPPATHDTEAGKAAAESVVSEPIKVGDVAKVVGASGDLTAQSDIGKIGEVLKIDFRDGTVLLSGGAGWVDHRDVRKVTT